MNIEKLKTLVNKVEFAFIGEVDGVGSPTDTLVMISPRKGGWEAYVRFKESKAVGYSDLEDYPEILSILKGQTVGFMLHL